MLIKRPAICLPPSTLYRYRKCYIVIVIELYCIILRRMRRLENKPSLLKAENVPLHSGRLVLLQMTHQNRLLKKVQKFRSWLGKFLRTLQIFLTPIERLPTEFESRANMKLFENFCLSNMFFWKKKMFFPLFQVILTTYLLNYKNFCSLFLLSKV